jgi:hypothetical protein
VNETLSTHEVCRRAGITPRQLRYWAEVGHLQRPLGGGGYGTAYAMRWSAQAAQRAEVLGAVSRLLGCSAIGPVARALPEGEAFAVLEDDDFELTLEVRQLNDLANDCAS